MTNEEILTDFMQKHYTDEKLAALLAHAEDGKLSFSSCCCFIGVATADHALRGELGNCQASMVPHYEAACELSGSGLAELAFLEIGFNESPERGRAAIIPLIRAEIDRRDRERSKSSSLQTVVV